MWLNLCVFNIDSKKVAKLQANYAQTVAHLMWETESSEIYM